MLQRGELATSQLFQHSSCSHHSIVVSQSTEALTTCIVMLPYLKTKANKNAPLSTR